MSYSEKKYKIYKKLNSLFNKFFGYKVQYPVMLNDKNIDEYCKSNKIQLTTTYNSIHLSNTVAINLATDKWSIVNPIVEQDYTYILEIKDSNYYLSNHYLFNINHQPIADDRIVFDRSLISQQYLPKRVKFLNGIICYLSNHWVENYYHWLQFALPLLQYYQNVIALTEIDYFYIGDTKLRRFHIETLELFGIPPKKIVNYPCTSKHILFAFPYINSKCGDFIFRSYDDIEFIRKAVWSNTGKLVETIQQRRKIYIKRGAVKSRKLINEQEVESLLRQYGFFCTSMDNLSFLDQAFLFYNADCIIGVHGAALANLMFAKSGTTVIEIFPENYKELSHFCTSYYRELVYYYLIAESRDYDLEVDINVLEHHLQLL